jgi:hypothetical protein
MDVATFAVLLVTLVTTGQPPHSFRIEMTPLHCDIAKAELEKEYAQKFGKANVTYSIICLRRRA